MMISKTHPQFDAIRAAALIVHKPVKGETRRYCQYIYSDGAYIYATNAKWAVRVEHEALAGYWMPAQVNKSLVRCVLEDQAPDDVPGYARLMTHDTGWADIAMDVDLAVNLTPAELHWRIATLTGAPWNYEQIRDAVALTGTDDYVGLYWLPGRDQRLIFEAGPVIITVMQMALHD